MNNKIQLGDTVKDTITNIEGIAVARTVWIAGCDRITVQPKATKKGELPESLTFDEPLLKVIQKKKKKIKSKNTGGAITRNNVISYGRG